MKVDFIKQVGGKFLVKWYAIITWWYNFLCVAFLTRHEKYVLHHTEYMVVPWNVPFFSEKVEQLPEGSSAIGYQSQTKRHVKNDSKRFSEFIRQILSKYKTLWLHLHHFLRQGCPPRQVIAMGVADSTWWTSWQWFHWWHSSSST